VYSLVVGALLVAQNLMSTVPAYAALGQNMPSKGKVAILFQGSDTENWYGTYYDLNNHVQGVTQGQPHSGVAITAPVKDSDCLKTNPVFTPWAGTVWFVGPDIYGMGYTVVLSHIANLGSNGHKFNYTVYSGLGPYKGSCIAPQVTLGAHLGANALLGWRGSSGGAPMERVRWMILVGDAKSLPPPSNAWPPYKYLTLYGSLHGPFPASPDFYTVLHLDDNDPSSCLGKIVPAMPPC
jgi:hypothetical protein